MEKHDGGRSKDNPSQESLERRKLELEIGNLSSKTGRTLEVLKGLTPLIAIIGTLLVGVYTGLFDKARLALEKENLHRQFLSSGHSRRPIPLTQRQPTPVHGLMAARSPNGGFFAAEGSNRSNRLQAPRP